MRAIHVFLVVAAMTLLAACGTTAGTNGPPSTSSQSATLAPSTEPPGASPTDLAASDPPAGAATLCAVEFEPCPITAGFLTTKPFSVPFTFTIDGADWTNDRNWPHGGSVTQAGSNAFLWASEVTSGQVDGAQVETGPTVDDFVTHLGRFEGWTVAAPVPVTIDGASGLQVDLTTNEVAAHGMYYIAEDAFNLAPGEKVRFIAVDKDGETVILVVDAFAAATFDAFVTEVGDPLLASISWE